MHPSVEEAWPAVAREHEGVLNWPYLDSVGLVTTGIGTLLDDGSGSPPEPFLALPWTSGTQDSTRAQRASGWHLTKSRIDLAPRGGYVFRDVTALRLDLKVINGLLLAKTREFWSVLSSQLPGLEEWPADAQLALIDMAYQLGANFLTKRNPAGVLVWKNFSAEAHDRHFLGCASNCSVTQASLARNQRRQRLFRNAALVVAEGIDPAILWDHRDPIKEEDMPLSDEDITRLAEAIKDKILPEIAAAVWTDDSADRIPSPDNLTRWLPSSYLQRIYLLLKPK